MVQTWFKTPSRDRLHRIREVRLHRGRFWGLSPPKRIYLCDKPYKLLRESLAWLLVHVVCVGCAQIEMMSYSYRSCIAVLCL